MHRILFVCHGNICRSPMAHSYMEYIVKKAGKEGEFYINSAATHTDKIGSRPYYATQEKLIEKNIPITSHNATLYTKEDGDFYDYILCMDEKNVRDCLEFFGEANARKVSYLMSIVGEDRAVADPWYTRDFEQAYQDIKRACDALLHRLSP